MNLFVLFLKTFCFLHLMRWCFVDVDVLNLFVLFLMRRDDDLTTTRRLSRYGVENVFVRINGMTSLIIVARREKTRNSADDTAER